MAEALRVAAARHDGPVSEPPALERLRLPPGMLAELRSDHAGETGAVAIYRGVLAVARDRDVIAFAARHLHAERDHLAAFDTLLPPAHRSRLLPLWRLSGWLLGALAALGGARGVYLTVETVETFVVEHYQRQIDMLPRAGELGRLRALLQRFQRDEDHHRQDAWSRRQRGIRWWERIWVGVVAGGSRAAVAAARRL